MVLRIQTYIYVKQIPDAIATTITCYHLPLADIGDCTDGVIVTVIGVLDSPPVILTITSINPDDSEPTNCPDVNSTISPTVKGYCRYSFVT